MRVRFGEFEFDGGRRQLRHRGEPVAIAPKPLALLELLLARRPEAVSKEEILDRIWGAVAISEGVLTTTVGELRQALGESAQKPRFLRTVHRYGYAFEGEVTDVAPEERRLRAVLVNAEQRIDLFDGQLVLGRHGGTAGDVADLSVSRDHARLHVGADRVEVEDLGSKNGTWVNGSRLEGRTTLRNGDELRLGKYPLVFRDSIEGLETVTLSVR